MSPIKAPYRHARRRDALGRAPIRARLPAIAYIRRWVFQKNHQLVEQRERLPVGVLGVHEAMVEGLDAADF